MAGLKPVRNALGVLFIVGLASHGVLGGNQVHQRLAAEEQQFGVAG